MKLKPLTSEDVMKKKKITELLKIYSEDLESLTPEECAQLHQYAGDQEKLGKELKKVMTEMLLVVHAEQFPRRVNLRTATIIPGSERAPSSILWEEIVENEIPIDQETFLQCAGLSMTNLREVSPVKAAMLERTQWYSDNKTETSPYIKWSKPIKKIAK